MCGRPVRPEDIPLSGSRSRCPQHPKTPLNRDGRYREQRERILAASTVCHICGQPPTADDPFVLDHVVARAYGGTDDPSNLAAAHKSCNGRKGAGIGPW
jgi:5-methylcytosine-specific restriction endonuclease McrA